MSEPSNLPGLNPIVLIADDNRDAADTLKAVIRAWGLLVEVAYDGLSALQVALQHRPHAFLIDIGMPRMSGWQLVAALRSNPVFQSALFVATTGYSSEIDRRTSASLGFDYHLTKPLDLDRLKTLLRNRCRLDEPRKQAPGRHHSQRMVEAWLLRRRIANHAGRRSDVRAEQTNAGDDI